ncbi:hypothetical protein ACN20G_17570 [Streptomyces sp. BI20]|uniref:hypothetical protein n=1 Tax=Streptomyces sp. BI20 TaxID=3403460 RepID=UPI003C752F08
MVTTSTPAAPARAPVGSGGPAGPEEGAVASVKRRSAWSEGVDRVRAAAVTEPGRLRIIGALLAALVVAFGAVAAWQVVDRAGAGDDVVRRSQPLSADAASVYRFLADADTAASSGFLAEGTKPAEVRARYEKDIEDASRLLLKAAANTDADESSRQEIDLLGRELPRYTGLVETARANNRQNLPLGGAYLRYANERMSTVLLPAAQRLYTSETARLGTDEDAARSWPWPALGVGVLALGALVWAQRRDLAHTNRVFNHGLVAATAAATVVVLWLAVGHTVARSGLTSAREDGQRSLRVLGEARIASLQARANENLTLVSRGAVLAADKKSDKYDVDYEKNMNALVAGLERAAEVADDEAGREPVRAAAAAAAEWRERHKKAREVDLSGRFKEAREAVVGGSASTGASFDVVDASLEKALAHEQREFTDAARGGVAAFDGLAVGAVVLALLGAAAALVGVGRRLSEYR